MEKEKIVKIIIKPPRCINCRERAKETDLANLGEVISNLIINKTGTGIPIQITITREKNKKLI